MLFPSKSQVDHISRRVGQIFKTPEIAVIGGYHGINVGDLALGYSVLNILKEKNISAGLQTIYNLEKWSWPLAEKAIIGGGAVGYNNLVELIAKRYKDYPRNVAFLGVDFNDQKYSEMSVDFLKKVRWISCRSKDQAARMKLLTGRNDITFHPDIAFALSQDDQQKQDSFHSGKMLLINIVPLYGKVQNGAIIPAIQYASERPELYTNWDKLQNGYRKLVRGTVEHYLTQGYTIESIAFTPMDHEAARILLKGMDVYHHSYYPNPFQVYKLIKKAGAFFASRYHATIFGLKANVKIIPFAYAKKNEQLLNDLNIRISEYDIPEDLIQESFTSKEIRPVIYDYHQVMHLQSEARLAMINCIESLYNIQ